MKINKDFMIREIADETVLVATGQASQNFNGMISINEVGSFILHNIEECKDEDELVSKTLDEFEVGENTAREDVREFVDQLIKIGVVVQD
ncbi:PqqD family protein [Terrisporobacter hibernicus]|uniref:PqqD family protein n=1 Tax=Terrisporobacter hibernicus TaxID=2813371 RepID=A0AAX2ZIV3_9FIRM|nr:PqqD family protein [Terrisporobacter hibernicus]UEL48746.1 PqqD family protein [Terrisporobacter hibernicus]